MRRGLILAASAWAAAAAVLAASTAQTTVFGAASVTQSWLAVGNDARTQALGGAVGVITEGNAALRDNPANLEGMLDPQLSLAHNEWDTDLGLREEYLAFGRRLGDGAGAASFRYFSFGSFENRDANGALLDSTNDNAFAGSLGYALAPWGDSLSLGGALTGSQEVLSAKSSTLFTGSLGLTYFAPHGLRAALAVLDGKLSGDSADQGPGGTRVSLGWVSQGKALQLDTDWTRPQLGDGTLRLGAEWTLAGNYSLRGGWRFSQGEGSALDAGPSFGGGIRLGDLRLDYAYVPYGTLSSTQQISATLYLGGGLFGGGNIIIEASGNSAEAQGMYNDGMAAFKDGDWAKAKVMLELALKKRPDLAQADQARQTAAEADRHIAADRTKGNSGEMKGLFAKKLHEAQDSFQKGELVATRTKLDEIFSIDPNLKEAVDLKRRLESTLEQKVAGLKNDAQNALQDGDLHTAVVRYWAVLKLQDDDAEARGRLIKLSPRIAEEVKRLHHEGIDAYVAGEMDRAIALWQQALDMDPADPRDIKRDLSKAKKMKELRAG